MIRTSEENDAMIATLNRRFDRQKPAIHLMEHFMSGGRICDLGCGNGMPLRYMAERQSEKIFVGMDHSVDILNKNNAAQLDNVLLVKGQMIESGFPDRHFDAVVFNKSLHEVYSLFGERGLEAAINTAASYLRPGGYLMIYENVIEDRDEVTIEFMHEEAYQLFLRFIEDYSIREIVYRPWREAEVKLRKDDAMEFLTKYREPNWECEMNEAHFIFTLSEWHRLIEAAGFQKCEAQSFGDRQILVTEGVRPSWDIKDFKYVLVYRRSA